MSKTIMQSLVVLVILLLASFGFVAYTLYLKAGIEQQNRQLQTQVEDYQSKEIKATNKIKDLEVQVKTTTEDLGKKKDALDLAQKAVDSIQKKQDQLSTDFEKARQEKTDIESRLTNIRRERDDLIKQVTDLKNRPPVEKIVEKIVYKEKPVEGETPVDPDSEGYQGTGLESLSTTTAKTPAKSSSGNIVINNTANEEYWAGIVSEKTALQMELDKIKKDLTQSQIKISELLKANSDYEVELGRLKNDKDEISRRIKYGEDLADSLSIELARARNDQKMTSDRAEKVEQDNRDLRSEIKQLTTTKVALEKSIARLSDEKANTEKKLIETESLIQNRIDEIWKIKKDIDGRFDARGLKTAGEVELPPIVVNGGAAPSRAAQSAPAARKTGTIVSVNTENNFVIVDMGENTGIKAGDAFRVYRSGSLIGSVEVIQVRQDISAADIKQKTAVFKPGDTVK